MEVHATHVRVASSHAILGNYKLMLHSQPRQGRPHEAASGHTFGNCICAILGDYELMLHSQPRQVRPLKPLASHARVASACAILDNNTAGALIAI